ncbi:DUF4199 domain-containing protein [Mucilaginibacter lappiensis]|uniref:DUF4199 domain-containing protein n=1 Tax=Mucilaginibacter lappiensis TaxID=354630 RepID=UPI003D22D813
MEIKKARPSQPAFKWALIGLVTTIVLTYAYQFLNIDLTSPVKYLNLIPFIAFLLLTQKEYKERLGGHMTFGKGFLSGFLNAIFVGLLSAVFTYVYYAILSPQMIGKAYAASRLKMAEQGLSQEQIDKALEIGHKYFAVINSGVAFLSCVLLGIVVALIGAAIFKKEYSQWDDALLTTTTG